MRKLFATIILLLFLSPSLCFASQTEHFKAEKISVTFPDGWEIARGNLISNAMKEKPGWKEEWTYGLDSWQHIFVAAGEGVTSDIFLRLSYFNNYYGNYYGYTASNESDDEDYDFNSEEKALLNFHDNNKEELFEGELYWEEDGTIVLGEPSFCQSDFETFIMVPVTITEDNKNPVFAQVYYTIIEDTIIVFRAESLTEFTDAQVTVLELIVRSFDDTGYYFEEAGNFDNWYDEYDESYDEEGFFTGDSGWPFFVIVAIVLGAVWIRSKLSFEQGKAFFGNAAETEAEQEASEQEESEDSNTASTGYGFFPPFAPERMATIFKEQGFYTESEASNTLKTSAAPRQDQNFESEPVNEPESEDDFETEIDPELEDDSEAEIIPEPKSIPKQRINPESKVTPARLTKKTQQQKEEKLKELLNAGLITKAEYRAKLKK